MSSAYFDKPEGMYQLRMLKMRLHKCKYNNLESSSKYHTMLRDINEWVNKVNKCIYDLINGDQVAVNRVVAIYYNLTHLSRHVNATSHHTTNAMAEAVEGIAPESRELYAKIVNYITAIECYYYDLMVRTLIPGYNDKIEHYTYVLETYIDRLHMWRNILLMGGKLESGTVEEISGYIRDTTHIMGRLPSHATLKASFAIIKRIIEVYNGNTKAIFAKAPSCLSRNPLEAVSCLSRNPLEAVSCCRNQHENQEEHREELRQRLNSLVLRQLPFTVDEATRHIKLCLGLRISYHHCTKY
jgi:hypothetical protein